MKSKILLIILYNMLTIPVWDLVQSYDGDSKIFSFDWPIFDGFFEDIILTEPLQFSVKLITTEEGIHAILSNVRTTLVYEGKKEPIAIPEFERIWKHRVDPLDPDDIYEISKNMTIDLAPVIREELIMAFHMNNL